MKDFVNNFVMPEKVALDCVGDTEISTVKLNSAAFDSDQYETCMFYDNGDSNVVARYKTLAEAVKNHKFLVEHEQAHLNVKMRHVGD
jgi:type IV secretory pathway component VirB8